jgi:hypothetical protein
MNTFGKRLDRLERQLVDPDDEILVPNDGWVSNDGWSWPPMTRRAMRELLDEIARGNFGLPPGASRKA